VLRKVDELEAERKRSPARWSRRGAMRDGAAARAVTEDQVGRMLDAMATDMERLDRDKLKDFLYHDLRERDAEPGHANRTAFTTKSRSRGGIGWRPHGQPRLFRLAKQ
jgi:hypothetical protein